jgi:hypothetical protein
MQVYSELEVVQVRVLLLRAIHAQHSALEIVRRAEESDAG